MVKRGGLELAMPEAVWEHMFRNLRSRKKPKQYFRLWTE